jgi:ethanolaminephosphotransferase
MFYAGTLYLSEINGPTEGLLMSIAILVISGIKGPQIWKTSLSSYTSILPPYFGKFDISQAMLLGMWLLLIFQTAPFCILRAIDSCKKKNISLIEPLSNLFQYFNFAITACLWLISPNSIIITKCFTIFCLAFGIAFGRITSLIILGHVTHSSYPKFNFLHLPFSIGLILSYAPMFGYKSLFTADTEILYVYGIFIFILVDYCLWSIKTVEQFCSHLKIKCFSIPYPSIKTKKNQ